MVYNSVKSNFKGNTAEFVDKNTKWINTFVKWNAAIVFSENEFSGSGDFNVQGETGKFTITGTRIE